MNLYSIKETTLIAIGDAIRAKNGTTNTYSSEEFAAAIEAIVATGGGASGGSGGPGTIEHIAITGVADTALSYQYDLTPYMDKDFYFLNWIRTTSGVDPYLQHFIYHAADGATESLSFANNPLTATKANASKSMGSLVNGILTLECYNSSYMVQKTSHLFVCNGGAGGSGGIVPEGELEIYDNGTYDVTEYASAVVSVEKGVFPEGDFPITENGQYNITRYNTVTVEVPTGGGTGDDLEYPVLSGTQNYACAGNTAGEWAVQNFGSKITTSGLEDTTYMFNMSSLETIPMKLNYIDYYHVNMNYMFNYAQNLTALPEFSYVKPNNMNSAFKNCRKLVDVEALANFDMSEQNKSTSYNAYESFYMCCSLRSIPVAFLKQLWNSATNSSRSSYGHTFMYCYSLDEISNWGVSTASLSSNMFSYTFDELCCLKRFTFDTNDDGTAKTAKWKNQVIDLSVHIGYDGSSLLQSIYFSGGRSFATQITDAASYATLKDNPNSWTKLREYSRYNRASAIETIQSLPDCSAYIAGSTANNNVIKFEGAAGSATDAGAINTMGQEYIDLAASKGWTVTFV